MKNRCSPEALLSIIIGMSKEQKEFVRSMGFGALLIMKITDIPLKLGFYVLQKFDSERMVIDIEGKELKVTAESVHDMLGIPIGGTKLTQLDQWPKDDTSYDEWKQQFKKDSIIRLSAIKNVIVSTTQADFNFKLNFLVLFVNTFCESISIGRCNLFPLSYMIVEEKTKSTTLFNFPNKEGNGEEDSDNDASQPEVDYLLDSNEAENAGIKNDADKNKKEGSPMSTGKTNTLVEKEKSEGVHKQGTKVEKTKGDDTGKENSEDRNKGGIEAKNTKDRGEDKHTKIEKGNAEDKGKKKSENENKKGEKADKTKGNKGDTHRSFSLGLSQDSDQTSSKKNALNPNPIRVSIPTEVGPSKLDLDKPREKKLADAFKSLFKCRITDTKPKLTHQESIICEWLFNLQGNTS
ncbi:unnamed protein product [Lactuca saligna]|uniref:Uncharacterized protein n=1 Tax=Lactuca saligna TaxID=75948 RepID=A0AA36E4C9_LACSI|nr:unnamed protein product [Lactuca saligna]